LFCSFLCEVLWGWVACHDSAQRMEALATAS
jgi:hypothetical protein